MWADIVLEKLLTILHPDPWAAERETLGLGWALKGSKATPNDTLPPTQPHFLIRLK